MIEDTINSQELELVETLYHPRGFAEVMFSVGDNLALFDPDKFLEIRMGQIPLLGFDHLIDYDPKLNEKQNFARRERAGNIAVFGGRNWGKTFVVEQLDFNQYAICTENENAGFSSFDYGHLSGVLDKMHLVWMKHPIISSFCERAIRGDYQFTTKFGVTIEGINMKVSAGASAGDGFFQKHLKRLWVEEASMESDTVYDKRADSKHEFGIIERLAGMTNFVKNSPAGKVFYEPKEAYRVVNLPQYCIAKGSKILMSDFTTKNIEKIKIGDEIFTFSSESDHRLITAKILNKINQGNKLVYNLNINENNLLLTSDHEFLTKTSNTYKTWKNINSLEEHHISYSLKYINDIRKYYEGIFLGILETEGSFKKGKKGLMSYSIGQKDEKECLEFILDKLKIIHTKYPEKATKDFFYYYIKTENRPYINRLYRDLEKNTDTQMGFISGCIVGDGSVNVYQDGKRQRLQLLISQKNKVELIDKILNKSKIKYNKIKCKNEMFQYFFPRLSFPFYAPKSKKYNKYLKAIVRTSLASIDKNHPTYEKNSIQEVWDLTTTSGTFIANGIIVHNCNPNYDERQDQERIKKWGGKSASGYKIFVKGEVCEDGENVFDMRLVRDLNYPHKSNGELDEKRTIKHIEITKKKYIKFKNFLSLIRPTNADTLYVTADIGQKGGITEIILISGAKEKFKYLYNITLINLTKPQQYEIFKHIVQTVKVDYLALDSTGGTGEAMYSDMQIDPIFKNVKLIWVAFNSNVPIGIDLDDKGNLIRKGGKIQEKMVNSVTQSVTRLCHLFYNALIFLPYDSRLDEQLDKVVSIVSKATHKVMYHCIAKEDHLYQAFQTFAIAQWLVEYGKLAKPKNSLNDTYDKVGVI